jgi:carboxymethylenebutenolidase
MRGMSTKRTEQVAVDGGRFDLHLWVPEAGSGPGLLLIQEIFGVGPYVRAVAERLAGLGYVVAAPDVFWRIERNWEANHDQAGLEASLAMVQKVDFPLAVADCAASLHHLEGLAEVSGGVGVIGFCFGGTIAFLLAAAAEPACCVSYYGSGVPGLLDQLDNVDCPVLLHFGELDSYIPADQVAAVADAVAGRANVALNLEQGGHAFDNHESELFYDEAAAKAAWAKTTAFLEEQLPT